MSDYEDLGAKNYKDNSKGEVPKKPATDQELNNPSVVAYRAEIAGVSYAPVNPHAHVDAGQQLEMLAVGAPTVIPELVELPLPEVPPGIDEEPLITSDGEELLPEPEE